MTDPATPDRPEDADTTPDPDPASKAEVQALRTALACLESDLAVLRAVLGHVLAEVAATKPAPRQWLAGYAAFLNRAAAETQAEVPASGVLEAMRIRETTADLCEAAYDALDTILPTHGRPGPC